MQKKVIGVILIILFASVIISLLVFYYFSKKQISPVALPNTFYNAYLDLENFLKKSAQQVENPLYGIVLPSADKKKSPQDTSKKKSPENTFSCKSQDFDCYEKYYRNIVKNEGILAAFEDLKVRYNDVAYIKTICHPLTHIIGQVATDKYTDVSEAYLHGDSFCSSGYYHGVLEGVAFKIGREKILLSLNNVCANVSGKEKYSFDYYNCVHGLGHGLMAMTEDELFESLKFCDNLTGLWEQQSCYGGVFMENVIVDNKNHFTKYLKPSEPLYPCSAVQDKYKGTCYLVHTSYMLKVTNENFVRVFELCSQVKDAFLPMCYQSLGRDASGRMLSNIELTKSICNLGKNYQQKSNCIIGAVKDFMSYYHSDVKAKQLCVSLDADLQDICNSTIKSYYQSFQ